jgi:Co/Zn/Cd efflux system component
VKYALIQVLQKHSIFHINNSAMNRHAVTFHVQGMDCPSEEQIIRMKLSGIASVVSLQFDLEARTITVIQQLPVSSSPVYADVEAALHSLKMGCDFVSANILDSTTEYDDAAVNDRRLLWQVLIINAIFFILESIVGFLSASMGLIADGLDMLADSIVYALALLSVGTAAARKITVSRIAGYAQALLALLGILEVTRRFAGGGDTPDYTSMVAVSALALVANVSCLVILRKSGSTESHMRASVIFTSNDVIANVGVIVAGILVFITGSMLPDLVVGSVVFVLVMKGAVSILSLS